MFPKAEDHPTRVNARRDSAFCSAYNRQRSGRVSLPRTESAGGRSLPQPGSGDEGGRCVVREEDGGWTVDVLVPPLYSLAAKRGVKQFFDMSRWSRLLVILLTGAAYASEESNQVAPYEDPNTALDGMWTECVAGLSFTCVQRKTLSFIDRLGRADKVPLLGGVLTLVKTGDAVELGRSADAVDDTDTLGRLVDQAVDSFFDTHVIRLTTPWFLAKDGRSSDTVDFDVSQTETFEGRKGGGGGGHGGGGHGGGGGGKRGMKKMMMMMCMMMVGKMMMMGPLMLGLTKIIALKALLLGSISLLISKIMILKKLKMGGGLGGGGGGGGWQSGGGGWQGGGGGGGGGWQSGGSGGGWDRAAHNIAYSAYTTSE